MSLDRFIYEIKLLGRKVMLPPVLVVPGFAVLATLLHFMKVDPNRFLSGGLEMFFPVTVGIVVATVGTQDAALELQLTMPATYHKTALLRLFITGILVVVLALLSGVLITVFHLEYMFQLAQPEAAPVQFILRQLAWFAPVCWFIAVGLCAALLIRSRSAAAGLMAGIWITEIIFKDFFFITDWLRPVSLFPTTLVLPATVIPQKYYDMWLSSRLEVLATGLVLLVVSWFLLHNTEALLKGSNEE